MASAPISLQPSDLGFNAQRFPDWREDQLDIINRLYSWATNPSSPRFFLLEAPTGVGKSLIAGALMRKLQDFHGVANFHGVITTTTKNLQTQYVQDTLTGMAASAWGKGNHECLILPPGTPADAAPCTFGFRCSQKSICPYYVERDAAHLSPISVLNTAFYLTSTNYVKTSDDLATEHDRPTLFSNAHLAIHDEAHLLEKAVVNLVEVNLNRDFFERVVGYPFPKTSETMAWVRYVNEVSALVESLSAGYEKAARIAAHDGQLAKDKDGKRAFSAYRALKTLRDELLPSRPLIQKTDYGYRFQPVWGKYFAPEYLFSKADKHLLMSATIIQPQFLADSLGIPEGDFEYLSLPSPFAPMRRRLIYRPVIKVTYRTSKKDFEVISHAIDRIAQDHEGQRGIIHSVSYTRSKDISDGMPLGTHARLITHTNRKGDKERAIAKYLASEDGILVSPSVGVGEDFGRGDNCRFQIFPKYPIPNLGDPLTKARQEDNPDTIWFEADMAFVQALGRGMRSADDFVTNYVLDAGAGWRLARLPAWVKESIVVQG